jgi:hypothetical protein
MERQQRSQIGRQSNGGEQPPDPDGNGRLSYVLQVGIFSDTLSTALKRPLKPVVWISPAPAGMATILEMFFTRETKIATRALN